MRSDERPQLYFTGCIIVRFMLHGVSEAPLKVPYVPLGEFIREASQGAVLVRNAMTQPLSHMRTGRTCATSADRNSLPEQTQGAGLERAGNHPEAAGCWHLCH